MKSCVGARSLALLRALSQTVHCQWRPVVHSSLREMLYMYLLTNQLVGTQSICADLCRINSDPRIRGKFDNSQNFEFNSNSVNCVIL